MKPFTQTSNVISVDFSGGAVPKMADAPLIKRPANGAPSRVTTLHVSREVFNDFAECLFDTHAVFFSVNTEHMIIDQAAFGELDEIVRLNVKALFLMHNFDYAQFDKQRIRFVEMTVEGIC